MRTRTQSLLAVLLVVAPLLAIAAPPPDDQVATNVIGMKLVPIPSGTFVMGSPESEAGRKPGEAPHTVTITEPFYLGQFEVTQGEYERVMGRNPSRNTGAQLPVDHISWHDAVAFCDRLSEMDPKFTYRLPTEAEWEYACRAGTKTRFYWGEDPNLEEIYRHAIFKDNSGGKTERVGRKKPNSWGLYDMNGHVWEWCQDWMRPYDPAAAIDPNGPESGEQKVCRGGCWAYDALRCRSAERNEAPADSVHVNLGMRVLAMPVE